MTNKDNQRLKRLPGARVVQTSYGEKRYGILVSSEKPGESDRGDVVWLGTIKDDSDPDTFQWTFNGLPKVERSVWLKNLTYKGADTDQWWSLAVETYRDYLLAQRQKEKQLEETRKQRSHRQEFNQLLKDLTALSRIDPEAA